MGPWGQGPHSRRGWEQAGWGHLSLHAANCSNPRVAGSAGPNGQDTGLAAPPHGPLPNSYGRLEWGWGGYSRGLWVEHALPGTWAAPETLGGGRWAGQSWV